MPVTAHVEFKFSSQLGQQCHWQCILPTALQFPAEWRRVKQHEVWAPPFIPTPGEPTKVHPKGNKSSNEQRASMPKASQENKGFQEQGGRNSLDVMTSANKSRTGLSELGKL